MGDFLMSKIGIDYDSLDNKIYKKAYKMSEVSDKIEKVAFDIVRFKDNDEATNLWQIQNSDDGEYIVALYDQDEEKVVESSWKVSFNKLGGTLNFFYKGSPIVKVAGSKLGIPVIELEKAAGYLPKKLETNKKLVAALIGELSGLAKKEVFSKHPELNT